MIQAVAVLAIVGLAVAVVDLRVTIVQNQEKIGSQDRMYTQQLIALKENLELQMKVLVTVVDRVTNNGFDREAGAVLTTRITRLEDSVIDFQVKSAEQFAEMKESLSSMQRDLDETSVGKMQGIR
jgi:GTP-binding protein EngB required for normal cell division